MQSFAAKTLENLKATLRVNCPERQKVRLLHENARPHAAKVTRHKLKEFVRQVLPHPSYLPYLAPSDYYLFRSLRSHPVTKHFDDEADL